MSLDRFAYCICQRQTHRLSELKWLWLVYFPCLDSWSWRRKWTISRYGSRCRLYPSVALSRQPLLLPSLLCLLLLSVCLLCGAWGIVVVIAFKTGSGSGARIFQLWSVKPITYLLREDTRCCVRVRVCRCVCKSQNVRANLWHLLWHPQIPSVLKFS